MKRKDFLDKSIKAGLAFTIVPRFVLGGTGYVSPSDRINLGYIGVGKQSYWLMQELAKCQEVLVQAACDVDVIKLNNFIEETNKVQAQLGKPSVEMRGYGLYRELLERRDIDAVVIASPDHWHAQMAVDAAKAGKDIYCEKPLALTIAEGRAMADATRKYKRVFQTGSMQRSSFNFRQAVELVRNGYIGEIKEVNVSIGGPVKQCDLPTMPVPEGLDWDMWVGPSLYRGYHPTLAPGLVSDWAGWRWYRDFGGGQVTDWGAHMFDVVQWALDMDNSGPVLFVPPKVPMAHEGLSFYYKNGVKVNHVVSWGERNAIQFIGSEGKIEVSRGFLRTNPANLASMKLKATDKRVYFSDNHYQDWIDAIKKRTKPICDVEIGHRTSSLCNIANIAYELQRDLKWDPKKEEFDNAYANGMRSRPYREPWDFTAF